MIRLRVYQGRMDKYAPAVSDNLIIDLPSAQLRAEQELTAHRAIFLNRTLDIPPDPALDIGNIREVIIPSMGISGVNEIVGYNLTLSEGITRQSVETRQIGGLTP